jgi:hypothetical protein
MGFKYNSKISVSPYNVAKPQPLDVRTVVESVDDLKSADFIDGRAYNGMVVFVDDIEANDRSLYVCFNKPEEIDEDLTNVEDVWKKLDATDYSVRIVEFESNLTDGTIKFPYQGMMVYVTSESALYILLTKGSDKAKDISNWRKISSTSTSSIDKIGIDVAPEGGTGFKITGNEGVVVDDYVNVENYIKADYFYTSKGVNSFDSDSNFTYDSVRLSKGGESYIELYTNGDNWILINDPDSTLGLSVSVKDGEFVMGEPIAKETFVCFGADIQFTDGWTISYGDETRPFEESDYELIDIYRSEYSPEVYAYLKDIDIRLLTEDDLVVIDDKMDNLANSIMIDLEEDGESDSSDSDVSESMPLQQVIVQMNNSISKLEQTVVEPESIDHSDIDKLFS